MCLKRNVSATARDMHTLVPCICSALCALTCFAALLALSVRRCDRVMIDSIDQSTGYTDRKADSKEECCNMCGMKSGCQDFVFEPASSTCVLLPHVPSSKMISSHNEYTVGGSLQITFVKEQAERHGRCVFATSAPVHTALCECCTNTMTLVRERIFFLRFGLLGRRPGGSTNIPGWAIDSEQAGLL